eukprot:Sspe_Gene.41538::Locus_20088_Transcript_1_1_Confidence_1.000_Length_1436::g.41538::m.41538
MPVPVSTIDSRRSGDPVSRSSWVASPGKAPLTSPPNIRPGINPASLEALQDLWQTRPFGSPASTRTRSPPRRPPSLASTYDQTTRPPSRLDELRAETEMLGAKLHQLGRSQSVSTVGREAGDALRPAASLKDPPVVVVFNDKEPRLSPPRFPSSVAGGGWLFGYGRPHGPTAGVVRPTPVHPSAPMGGWSEGGTEYGYGEQDIPGPLPPAGGRGIHPAVGGGGRGEWVAVSATSHHPMHHAEGSLRSLPDGEYKRLGESRSDPHPLVQGDLPSRVTAASNPYPSRYNKAVPSTVASTGGEDKRLLSDANSRIVSSDAGCSDDASSIDQGTRQSAGDVTIPQHGYRERVEKPLRVETGVEAPRQKEWGWRKNPEGEWVWVELSGDEEANEEEARKGGEEEKRREVEEERKMREEEEKRRREAEEERRKEEERRLREEEERRRKEEGRRKEEEEE